MVGFMHVTEKLIPNSIVPFSKANIISTAALINGGLLFCLLLGMTSQDIRIMSEDALLDMDYFLNDDELDDCFGEEGFYIF